MRVDHQLKAVEQILSEFDGKIPLHRFLPGFFKQRKQMGSSDRRWASRYIYSFFRLGKALKEESIAVRIAVADFLCHSSGSLIQSAYLPHVSNAVDKSLSEKIEIIVKQFPAFKIEEMVSFGSFISPLVDLKSLLASYFIQPDVFLKALPKNALEIESILTENHIEFNKIGDILAVPNATKLNAIIPPSIQYRIQDLSSQHTANYYEPNKYDYWWDCCAASGGKSILLYELEPTVQLLVSDVRESILKNLEERFRLAGIKKYQSKVLDLLQNNDQILYHYAFDGILLDAPCTGSGTWGRTPEMLSFFEENKIDFFANLQQKIGSQVIKYLKVGKPLIYSTCSIFKKENEDVVEYLINNFPLRLERMELINGTPFQADSLFVARLIKTEN